MRVKSPSRIAAGSPSREVNRTAYTNCTILTRRVEPQIPGIFAPTRWQSRWAADRRGRLGCLFLASPLTLLQPFLVLRVKPFEIDTPALLFLDQLEPGLELLHSPRELRQ